MSPPPPTTLEAARLGLRGTGFTAATGRGVKADVDGAEITVKGCVRVGYLTSPG